MTPNGVTICTGIFCLLLCLLHYLKYVRFQNPLWMIAVIGCLPQIIAGVYSGFLRGLCLLAQKEYAPALVTFVSFALLALLVLYSLTLVLLHPYPPGRKQMDEVVLDVVIARRTCLYTFVSIVISEFGLLFYLLGLLFPDFKNPFTQGISYGVLGVIKKISYFMTRGLLSEDSKEILYSQSVRLFFGLGVLILVFLIVLTIIRTNRATPIIMEKDMVTQLVLLCFPVINLFAVIFIYKNLILILNSYKKTKNRSFLEQS